MKRGRFERVFLKILSGAARCSQEWSGKIRSWPFKMILEAEIPFLPLKFLGLDTPAPQLERANTAARGALEELTNARVVRPDVPILPGVAPLDASLPRDRARLCGTRLAPHASLLVGNWIMAAGNPLVRCPCHRGRKEGISCLAVAQKRAASAANARTRRIAQAVVPGARLPAHAIVPTLLLRCAVCCCTDVLAPRSWQCVDGLLTRATCSINMLVRYFVLQS
ncbi:hypothetical protein HAX54_003318 [Datura stramonium]|uniref:Uncharacterized protein n=1 Tax=Datura stramonium TaxID=4076 RepID=A0ABS8WW58_DATST|nr:hypothetical protein [Datura stramonium]